MSILKKAVLAGAVCAVVVAGQASGQSFGFAHFHAIVSAKGILARSSGVKAVTHPSIGRYLVQFTREVNVKPCVYTASPYGESGGQASMQVVPDKPDMIAVFTFSRTGVPADNSFNLVVTCS